MPPTGCRKEWERKVFLILYYDLLILGCNGCSAAEIMALHCSHVLGRLSQPRLQKTPSSTQAEVELHLAFWDLFGPALASFTQLLVLLNTFLPSQMIHISTYSYTKWRTESCSQEDIKNKKSGENLKMEYFVLLTIAKDFKCCYSLTLSLKA